MKQGIVNYGGWRKDNIIPLYMTRLFGYQETRPLLGLSFSDAPVLFPRSLPKSVCPFRISYNYIISFYLYESLVSCSWSFAAVVFLPVLALNSVDQLVQVSLSLNSYVRFFFGMSDRCKYDEPKDRNKYLGVR